MKVWNYMPYQCKELFHIFFEDFEQCMEIFRIIRLLEWKEDQERVRFGLLRRWL
jgi:hypothetical protein